MVACSFRAVRFSALALSLLSFACGSSDSGGAQSKPTTDAAPADAEPPDAGPDDAKTDDVKTDDVDVDVGPDAVDTDVVAADAAEGGLRERRTFIGASGTREYVLYVPPGAGSASIPLVMVLHGCSQTADGFASLTGFETLANQEGFAVVFPEQPGTANPLLCWNWFLDEDQQRDTGEAAVLADIVREVMDEGWVDNTRVHAVGLSAGGAMSIVLAAVFPDVFASVGAVAGCPFKGSPCLNAPSSLTGEQLADLAYTAMGALARPVPVFLAQGDADTTVPPENVELVVQQWLGVADRADDGQNNGSVSRNPSATSNETVAGGRNYVIATYVDGAGAPLLEQWLIKGTGHAWPGGASGVAFSDPAGPDAAAGSYAFFSAHPML